MKDRVIYSGKNSTVYINQCHNPGKKTKLFAIRKYGKTGLGELLGIIRFDGAWRQYITEFLPDVKWSAGCKENIAKFEREMNKKWRQSKK